ncbi:DNA glycosylase [Paludicola sp. MB14-C6]|uniref:DNA-3-methyladenine glycosylase family protein n=1 Tax=Paludihabitans sp. MB14-C6 TaxID=3070656 RepID=UPI0027DBDF1D|nr:DNA glycosylase [Paludicola sp. MB14-C6]WMJ23049.1 DNA glycosylase [Paludicola sp. MB14-C6]
MKIATNENNLHLSISQDDLHIVNTLDCGQCFRWRKQEDNKMTGVVFDRVLTLKQTDDEVIFYNTTIKEFNDIWKAYFDLDTDYQSIKKRLMCDQPLKASIEYAKGLRILKQDSFEALCSFIISQNNNIPRIKSTIEKLCERYGNQLSETVYAFPTASVLSQLEKKDLQGLSLGYRDEYLLDCAKKVQSGQIKLEQVGSLPIDEARAELRTIKGVGPKVAECALLFGFYKVEAFPIDTWIKKVLSYYYTDGFPKEFSEIAGIAQQYLFHYIRTSPQAPKIG